ncbi:DUF1439 domain-containing protein [Alteromonas sp. 1_MG-2023]|uniref:DUF1439 domain-containing protein n=1 Tax=Alteromonas sp. 1_MG-2023 TaxID=3062669 RepID=UPI0026E2D0B0|nr:DUF1439 domain-containing protein [Alteromonas sp. 1_MG-2023]MDO6474828.1 DUF1439 domain-containing protein [Alteromonas sp. 1_MG-2023]
MNKISASRLLVVLVCIIIAGCSTLASLASYSVTSADLQRELDKQVTSLQEQASVVGIPILLEVNDMQVNVGPDNRQTIQLIADATATLSVLGLTYPAKVKLDVEGMPYYDSSKKAVFIRSLVLNDTTVDAMGYRGNLAPVSSKVMGLLNQFLMDHPVYEVKNVPSGYAWLTNMPLSMTVESGKIVFRPQSAD